MQIGQKLTFITDDSRPTTFKELFRQLKRLLSWHWRQLLNIKHKPVVLTISSVDNGIYAITMDGPMPDMSTHTMVDMVDDNKDQT